MHTNIISAAYSESLCHTDYKIAHQLSLRKMRRYTVPVAVLTFKAI